MKKRMSKKSRRHKNRPQKKCIIVTSEQVKAVKESIALSGQAVFLGATITAVSLFSQGCVEDMLTGSGMFAKPTKPKYCGLKPEDICTASPEKLVEIVKGCEDYELRSIIFQNLNLPADVLAKLAEDEDRDIRKYVAENPNTPVSVLAKFAEDKYWGVRGAVAGNPSVV